MDRELLDYWRPILTSLHPWRQLRIDEVERLYTERPEAPHRRLATRLFVTTPPSDVKILFVGARGAGKTTELTRLAHQVRGEFAVVQTDLAIGLPDRAGTLAIITLLGAAALRVIGDWAAPDGDITELMQRPITGRFKAALQRFGESVPAVADLIQTVGAVVTYFEPASGAVIQAGGKALSSASDVRKNAAALRYSLTRAPLTGHIPLDKIDDARALVESVNELLTEIETLSGRPPLLIVEGLDRRKDLKAVEEALANAELLRSLAAPLILAGPVSLRHDPRFRGLPGDFDLIPLHNVGVCSPPEGVPLADEPCDAEVGITVMRDLYHRRREVDRLPLTLIDDDLIERAARMSAGIVRHFLEFLHEAGQSAFEARRRTITANDLESALRRKRLEMTGYLNDEHYKMLDRVLDKGTLPAHPEVDVLLFENFIACYPNGKSWFRPHELIVDVVLRHAGKMTPRDEIDAP